MECWEGGFGGEGVWGLSDGLVAGVLTVVCVCMCGVTNADEKIFHI